MESNKSLKQLLSIPLTNKLSVFGMLHLPNTDVPPPLVVIFHGLSSNKYGTSRSHVDLSLLLASQGIASLRTDLPGHGDSDGLISDFSFKAFVNMTKEIIQYSFSIDSIDNSRIALFGSSFGGTLSLLSYNDFPLLRALALWAPVIHGATLIQDAITNNVIKKKHNSSKTFTYKDVILNEKFQKEFSEIDIPTDIRTISIDTPVLFLRGAQDLMISIKQEHLLLNFLKEKGVPYDNKTYPQVDHSLASHRHIILQDLLSWFYQQLCN